MMMMMKGAAAAAVSTTMTAATAAAAVTAATAGAGTQPASQQEEAAAAGQTCGRRPRRLHSLLRLHLTSPGLPCSWTLQASPGLAGGSAAVTRWRRPQLPTWHRLLDGSVWAWAAGAAPRGRTAATAARLGLLLLLLRVCLKLLLARQQQAATRVAASRRSLGCLWAEAPVLLQGPRLLLPVPTHQSHLAPTGLDLTWRRTLSASWQQGSGRTATHAAQGLPAHAARRHAPRSATGSQQRPCSSTSSSNRRPRGSRLSRGCHRSSRSSSNSPATTPPPVNSATSLQAPPSPQPLRTSRHTQTCTPPNPSGIMGARSRLCWQVQAGGWLWAPRHMPWPTCQAAAAAAQRTRDGLTGATATWTAATVMLRLLACCAGAALPSHTWWLAGRCWVAAAAAP